MPSGVIRLRNSRKAATSMPRDFHSLTDISGIRGTETRHTVMDIDKNASANRVGLPNKVADRTRPFADYPLTPTPPAAEEGANKEGPKRGRQADKSSRLKK